MPARLNPYLTFPGNAREAMEYYHHVLGGNLVLTTFAEGGMADNPADADKVMHGQLETDNGFTLMGSDARSDAPGEPMSGVQISSRATPRPMRSCPATTTGWRRRARSSSHSSRLPGETSSGWSPTPTGCCGW